MKKYIVLFGVLIALSSCDSFLEREPISFKSETAYFHTSADFELSVNDLYKYLPQNNNIYGGTYNEDCKSDNQCSAGYYAIFLSNGDYKTQAQSNNNNIWNFNRLRAINYSLNKIEKAINNGEGNDVLGKHYLGEAYFFRAYEYFRLLSNYGDLPILTEIMNDDEAQLTAASKRYPRNEVARFIIENLYTAIGYLQDTAPGSGRICKDAAYALLSRVALYEGTWEKYHAGTCFVPGNDKWPGKTLWPDFKFKAGSAEEEVNYFLDEAIKASDIVASKRSLNANYQAMFNNYETVFGNDDEVILARYYQKGVLSHSCSAFLKNGGGCGATRALVNSFLMKNGMPIYVPNSGYKGDDKDTYTEFQGRDERLTVSVRAAGSYIETHFDAELNKNVNDTIFYNKPYIFNTGNEKSTTGYDINKWLVTDYSIDGFKSRDMGGEQRTQYNCTTAVPIFRAAECYLNYIEAYYERYGELGANCAKYWQAIRQRAGVSTDFQLTINRTDLDKENDLAVYSHGKQVDKTLYNIRRERRCEFIAEGMRFADLKRWRALDTMKDYQPEGMRLWDTSATKSLYSNKELSPDLVSQSGISNYIHPLQIAASSAAYTGYNFPKAHYLEPIPVSEFLLCIDEANGVTQTAIGKSMLYQNPGWPSTADGPADYNFDCE